MDILIRSKVQSPVVRESTLARGRLLAWLDQHAEERVRVLAAEAGFGKTTLLADWARRCDRPVRWLKLDPTDAEWTTFLSYLIAAFREDAPDFGMATQRLLAHLATLGTTLDQALGSFLGELGALVVDPTVLIIDDLQHVQENADVRVIMERLIERAPEGLAFILSGRSRPELRLGRLTAQGRVAGLTTDDLRFTRQETGDLFAHGYKMPLDTELVGVVDARTEGWGASLQLLYSSIRSQRPTEVREFIRGLEGSREPLYDFLAEEVLDRQTPLMQRVLLHAALLDRIVPQLVVAALTVSDAPPSADAVVDTLDEADELGLMSRNAHRSNSRRFHPLLREFLASQLLATTPTPRLKEMHHRVAQAAESIHWPTAAHHYIEADHGQDAMRVIGESSVHALGTGAWGAAMGLVERIPHIEPSVAVQVIRARSLVAGGNAQAAIDLLESITARGPLEAHDRALVRFALVSALFYTARLQDAQALLMAATVDSDSPRLLSSLVVPWYEMMVSRDTTRTLQSLEQSTAVLDEEGLHLFSAISRHNIAVLRLALGDTVGAIASAESALAQFSMAQEDSGTSASAFMVIAHAQFDQGLFADSMRSAAAARADPDAQADVFAEASLLLVWLGRAAEARPALSHGSALVDARAHLATDRDALMASSAFLQIALGDYAGAYQASTHLAAYPFDPNQTGLVLLCRASGAAVALPQSEAVTAVEVALRELKEIGAIRWLPHLQLLHALVSGDAAALGSLIGGDGGASDSTLLAMADVIGVFVHQFGVIPERVERLARAWPGRWRPVLRHALEHGDVSAMGAAAALLAEIGERPDVDVLARWEKNLRRTSRDRPLSLSLARRVSPTLRILDLGRVSVALAGRSVRLTEVRRKAASLLLYLVSRPKQTATRDQVLEALWPGLETTQAANSLHQTLYFLRRELVASPKEGKPIVEYIPIDSEIIYLDPDLVHIESASFLKMAAELAARAPGSPLALSLIPTYQGRFAPEFEYEDWAIHWRDQVHSAFLNLTEQAARARLNPRNAADAAALLRHALEVDPDAYDLKPLLAQALYLAGSHAAARHLYELYREESLREYGETPPSLQALLDRLG